MVFLVVDPSTGDLTHLQTRHADPTHHFLNTA
jgi:hypothetical protein